MIEGTGSAASKRLGRLLLTTTVWWPSIALLATTFEQAGFETTLLCPKGHSGWATRIAGCLELDPSQPLRCVSQAIQSTDPLLIVPADDRALSHLHALHADGSSLIRTSIERSLGSPQSFPIALSRATLMATARNVGMPTPLTSGVRSRTDLHELMRRIPGPWVLKIDETWGGEGVRVVHTAEAARKAYKVLTGPRFGLFALKRRLINRDPFWWMDWRLGKDRQVSIQGYIHGRPGNLALFCCDGEVLGATAAEVEDSAYPTGPSTFVRVVDRGRLLEPARRLMKEMRMSGFIGLDYMIDRASGEAILIEMNPRITALCNLRLQSGLDPVSAAASMLLGDRIQRTTTKERTLYAHFPLAWRAHPNDSRLDQCQDDIPWDHPEFVTEGLDLPWDQRGLLARAYACLVPQHKRAL